METNNLFAFKCTILIFVNILIICGNSLVIISVFFATNLRKTVTNMLIASVACADLLLGCCVIPFSAIYEVFQEWLLSEEWCTIWLALDVFFCTASILNLCAISFDRYVAITSPIRYPSLLTKTKGKLLIMAVWLAAAAISIPPLIGWTNRKDFITQILQSDSEQDSMKTEATEVLRKNITRIKHSEHFHTSDFKQILDYIISSSIMSSNLEMNETLWICGVTQQHSLSISATLFSNISNFCNTTGLKLLTTKSPTKTEPPKQSCELQDDQGYVIYSALGSFYIPTLVMVILYWNIFSVATKTRKAMTSGVLTTTGEKTIQMRVHRGGGSIKTSNTNDRTPIRSAAKVSKTMSKLSKSSFRSRGNNFEILPSKRPVTPRSRSDVTARKSVMVTKNKSVNNIQNTEETKKSVISKSNHDQQLLKSNSKIQTENCTAKTEKLQNNLSSETEEKCYKIQKRVPLVQLSEFDLTLDTQDSSEDPATTESTGCDLKTPFIAKTQSHHANIHTAVKNGHEPSRLSRSKSEFFNNRYTEYFSKQVIDSEGKAHERNTKMSCLDRGIVCKTDDTAKLKFGSFHTKRGFPLSDCSRLATSKAPLFDSPMFETKFEHSIVKDVTPVPNGEIKKSSSLNPKDDYNKQKITKFQESKETRSDKSDSFSRKVYSRKSARKPKQDQGKRFKTEAKAARTLSIVVGLFTVCWTPFFVMYLLGALIPTWGGLPGVDWITPIAIWLGYCNSAINPFIYAMFSRDFRRAFKQVLSCNSAFDNCYLCWRFREARDTAFLRSTEIMSQTTQRNNNNIRR